MDNFIHLLKYLHALGGERGVYHQHRGARRLTRDDGGKVAQAVIRQFRHERRVDHIGVVGDK